MNGCWHVSIILWTNLVLVFSKQTFLDKFKHSNTAWKMEFSIQDFFSKYDHNRFQGIQGNEFKAWTAFKRAQECPLSST